MRSLGYRAAAGVAYVPVCDHMCISFPELTSLLLLPSPALLQLRHAVRQK